VETPHQRGDPSATFTGLTNGTQDCVRVQAVSSGGQAGTYASACAIPASRSPAPPTAVHASLNGTTATVTWTPPAPSAAYPAPANYLVTPSGGAPQTVAASTATFTNLNEGTTYTFTVASLIAGGTASAAAASNPASDGRSPIAPYTISVAEAGGSASTSVVASPGTYAEAAPAQGATYNVSITATNGAGFTSPPASNSATTTFATKNLYLCYRAPSSVPGAPPEDYMLSQQSNHVDVATWMAQGFTSNQGGFYAAG
jgi:Fibronectin type III domain